MWPADGVEILNLIDDHSRFCLASVAFRTVKATDVLDMELELERLGVVFKHSTPYHPQPVARSVSIMSA